MLNDKICLSRAFYSHAQTACTILLQLMMIFLFIFSLRRLFAYIMFLLTCFFFFIVFFSPRVRLMWSKDQWTSPGDWTDTELATRHTICIHCTPCIRHVQTCPKRRCKIFDYYSNLDYGNTVLIILTFLGMIYAKPKYFPVRNASSNVSRCCLASRESHPRGLAPCIIINSC